jgi:hypothetical protein
MFDTPWRVVEESARGRIIVSYANNVTIFRVAAHNLSGAERDHIAKVGAAAPELYTALDGLVSALELATTDSDVVTDALGVAIEALGKVRI